MHYSNVYEQKWTRPERCAREFRLCLLNGHVLSHSYTVNFWEADRIANYSSTCLHSGLGTI